MMLQALMPFAASPTFGFLYKATVATFPQAFIFLVIAIYFVLLALISLIHFMAKSKDNKLKAENEPKSVVN